MQMFVEMILIPTRPSKYHCLWWQWWCWKYLCWKKL